MRKFNPEKLFVDIRPGVNQLTPIVPRRYTLTHSDITGELFLIIAPNYAYEKIDPMRDEVLAEWVAANGNYYFNVYVLVDGQFGPQNAIIRNIIFRRELPLALKAIKYGDKQFFDYNTSLDSSPIIIHFNSSIPEFNTTEAWGTFSSY